MKLNLEIHSDESKKIIGKLIPLYDQCDLRSDHFAMGILQILVEVNKDNLGIYCMLLDTETSFCFSCNLYHF